MHQMTRMGLGAAMTLGLVFLAGYSSGFTFVPKAQLKVEKAQWTHAPNMPPPIARNEPRLVTVDWTATETQKEIVDGQMYQQYWTFEGSVPGPVLRVRQGDVVRVSLTNAVSSKMAHNIDFHFVTGQGGGAAALSVQPGQTATIEVRAIHPGFFMYHCATHDIPEHIGNGMYGYVLVEPVGGLPKADREYYVVQSEFYADETPDGKLVYSSTKADAETPTFMFFNGSLDALMEDNALKAEVGDVVRLYVGNAGPNKISSFHVIGEIFDRVWREGDLISPPARSVQTTLIPAGGGTVVEFETEQPATYLLVDHAINRIHIGLMGQLVVSGTPNLEIFEAVKAP